MNTTAVQTISVLGRGNVNAFVLTGHRAVLVDTGVPGSGPKIMAALADHGLEPAEVSAIVVTHGHIDHFGSAAYLRQELDAPILAHRDDVRAYTSGRSLADTLRPTGPFGRLFGMAPPIHESTQPFRPDITLDGPMSLHSFGVDAQILATPGHTPGSLSVLTAGGELIAADMIAGSFLGTITRRPANPPFHHDRLLNLASLEAALAHDPVAVYVGHGGPLAPDRVRRWATRERRRLAALPPAPDTDLPL